MVNSRRYLRSDNKPDGGRFVNGLFDLFAPLSPREKLLMCGLIIAVLIILLSPILRATDGEIGSLFRIPSKQCSSVEAWLGPELVTGQPQVDLSSDNSGLNSQNSASWTGKSGSLTCLGFESDPELYRINNTLGLSLAISQSENDIDRTIDSSELSLNTATDAVIRIDDRSEPLAPNSYGETAQVDIDGILEVQVSDDNGASWQSLHLIDLSFIQQESSFISIALPENYARDLETMAVRVQPVIASETEYSIWIDSIFVDYELGEAQDIELKLLDESGDPIEDEVPLIEPSSDLEIELRSKDPDTGFWQGIGGTIADTITSPEAPPLNVDAEILSDDGMVVAQTEAEGQYKGQDLSTNDTWLFNAEMPIDTKPGKYTMSVKVFDELGNTQLIEQDFLWGVLSLNSNQSVYKSGETAYIDMTVLDEQGATVCNAELTLLVEGPDQKSTYTTSDGSISIGENCTQYGPDYSPDYHVEHSLAGSGDYKLTLSATTEAGNYQIIDLITVNDEQPIYIDRQGPTRAYPPVTYPMRLRVKAQQDFNGVITEKVPASFDVDTSIDFAQQVDSQQTTDGETQLSWKVDIKAGESLELGYDFTVPSVSPAFYLMGPAEARVGSETVFKETRQWQIAGDAVGEFAVYREATGTELIGTTLSNQTWDNTVTQGSGFSINGGRDQVTLSDGGHYFVSYNLALESASGSNRSEIQGLIDVNGTDLAYGRSTCYIRRTGGTDQCWLTGSAIIETSAGATLTIEAQRTDNNSATVQRRANESGLTIVQLDDSWNYARITDTTGGTAYNSATYADINWNNNDELDAGSFSRTGSAITLVEPGHYLVTANTMFQNSSGSARRSAGMRLTLDGTEIEGTRTTAYLRGSNSTQNHVAVYSGIIETTSTNQVLRLQAACDRNENCGGSSVTNVGGQTAISLVKLSDFADYIRLHHSSTDQPVDSTSNVIWDTNDEIDTSSFSHTAGSSNINIDANGDYLFFSTFYNERSVETVDSRLYPHWQWRVSTNIQEYSSFGKYDRGENGSTGTFSSGSSGSFLGIGLSSSDIVDILNTDQSTGSDSSDYFVTDRLAFQGLRIDSLFPSTTADTRQLHFRWRDDSTDLNTGGGWLGTEDNNAIGNVAPGDVVRLRMEVANVGGAAESAARTYELQFGDKTGLSGCSSVSTWTGVTDATDDFQMIDSTHIDPDGESTTSGLLANSEGLTRINGEGRDAADTTGAIGPLSSNNFTELEYSITVGSSAVTGHQYCFRLYDVTAGSILDAYSAFPRLTIDFVDTSLPSGLGEAGTFTSTTDGSWTTVNFIGNYTTPVVVGTSNESVGDNGLVFESRNVSGTQADMRLCKSQGGTATGCDTMSAVDVGYMVVDAAQNANFDGFEAGTFSISGQFDATTTSPTYSESFATTPIVFANVQSDNGTAPTETRLTTTSTTGFTAGICQQNSNDGCDGGHPSETVGWVALEPGNLPFSELSEVGTADTSNSNWVSVGFADTFDANPVAIVEQQTNNGGQDVEIDEAQNVSTSSMEVRFCEMDAVDTCDNHTTETVGWFAIESGEFSTDYNLSLKNWRVYENIDNVQPTTAIATEQVKPNTVDDTEVIRLRLNFEVGVLDIGTNEIDLTLQYSQASDCSVAGSWTDVGAIGSGAVWRGYNNASPANGANISSTLLSDSNVTQSYVEQNDSPTNPNSISDGQKAEWDFVVENNGAPDGTDYCFRPVLSTGDPFHYSTYPQVATTSASTALYVESDQSFSASTGNSWTTIDLSSGPYNIPINSVVEIAVGNSNAFGGTTAGVRSVGSSVDRFLEIREAESGGVSFMVMHVQTDSNGEIQYYTSSTGNTDFEILGYWESGSFIDSWDNFNPGVDTTWTNIDLSSSPYDVPVNRVVEVVAANGENASENQAGIQMVGGSDARIVDISEAENPTSSFSTWTAFTQADENSQIEVYAEDDSEMEFYFSGYWDVQPGHYTETANNIPDPTSDGTWQTRNLSGAPYNVPGEAIAEVILLNGDTNAEDLFGARSNGSSLNRFYDIYEAESGGRQTLRIHTPTDSSSNIQLYHEDVSDTPFEYALAGYWLPNITPDNPASLSQTRADDSVIATGEWINETTVEFKATISDTEVYEALEFCVELQPLGSPFTTVDTACSGEYAYNGVNVNAEVSVSVSDQTQYHWQARVRDVAADVSSWVSYGGNLETARDFGTDTIAPIGGNVYDGDTALVDVEFNDGSLDTLEANWANIDSDVSGLAGYEYSVGTTPGGTDILGWTSNGTNTSFVENTLVLNTSQPYYSNVRTTDNAGNTAVISSDGQFVAPTLSFSTSPGSIDLGSLNAGNNFTGTSTTTLTTSTNAYNGYIVRAYATGILTSQNGDTIGMFNGGTYLSPDEWQLGDTGYGYHSEDTLVQGVNIFNSAPCPGTNNPPCYAPWSLSAPGDIIADHTSLVSGTPIVNEQFDINHRVTTDSSQEAGTYTTTIIYSITAIY